jgi:hypothetical protein
MPDLLKDTMKNLQEDQSQMKMLSKLMTEQNKAAEKKSRLEKMKQNNETRAASRMNKLQAQLEN